LRTNPRVLAQPLDGEVLNYRHSYGLQVDAVVQLADGRWGAIEVKLGEGIIDAAAENLRRFPDRVDTERSGPPTFLAVICGMGLGYLRPDGVSVIPAGALGP
jgi:hypothetical protein